ncbi:unnamed protein product [Linum trigynum]|uniref:BHLH domain-containing protein n=1 Tax=Linum trigynum TaxID=586398 RepID=A0AAV2F2F5_9ROSI
MALEAAIYSQDPFGYPPLFKDHYGSYDFHQEEEEEEGEINRSASQSLDDKIMLFNDSIATPPPPTQQSNGWDYCYYNNNSSPEPCRVAALPPSAGDYFYPPPPGDVAASTPIAPARRKRRRTKNTKNEEEIESQRMTHIAVERNRRKQMNEYLALLRSLMPSSYAQRGDQASIIGGAINYVKELEQLLQAMEAQKTSHHQQHAQNNDGQAGLTDNGRSPSPLFSEFFDFPQYSTRNRTVQAQSPPVASGDGMAGSLGGVVAREEAAVGEVEVTMAESHANVKILARKQHRQLVKLVAGLQGLGFTILHLNVTTTTTSDQMVLYTVSFKVEEGCFLNTVDEIAAAVNQMLRRIEEGSYYTDQTC